MSKKIKIIYAIFCGMIVVVMLGKIDLSIVLAISPLKLLFSILLQLLSIILLPLAWFVILKRSTTKKVRIAEVYRAYASAWLGRYLPGKVTLVLGRAIYGEKIGVSKQKVIYSTFVEILLQLASLISVGIILSFVINAGYIGSQTMLIAFLILIGFVIVLYVLLYGSLFQNFISRFTKEKVENIPLWLTDVISILGIHITSMILSGLHFMMLFNIGINDVSMIKQAITILSTYYLAIALGMVSIFAPSGAGVREVILFQGLKQFLIANALITIIGLSRFVTIVADFAFTGITLIITSNYFNSQVFKSHK